MNDNFAVRVWSAAVAAWWTVLVSVVFLLVMTAGYETIVLREPSWLLRLSGPDITWSDIEHTSLRVIVAFRFVVWMLALAAVWLTIWGHKLRKATVAH